MITTHDIISCAICGSYRSDQCHHYDELLLIALIIVSETLRCTARDACRAALLMEVNL